MSDNEYPDEYLDENGNEYQEEKPEQERGELKPCPFCGEPVVFNKFAEKVVCEDCGATIYSDYWNTRPIEDNLIARIAELEAENEKINYFFRRLRMFCIFAHWDNPNTEAEFCKVDAEISEYLSEHKACIDQLTAHDATERQDDKPPNDTQVPKQEETKPALTLSDVRAVLAKKSQAGFTKEIKALIHKYGAEKLSAVDPKHYEALLKEVEELEDCTVGRMQRLSMNGHRIRSVRNETVSH